MHYYWPLYSIFVVILFIKSGSLHNYLLSADINGILIPHDIEMEGGREQASNNVTLHLA